MKLVELSKLGRTVTGKTPSSNNPDDFGDLYCFVTPTDSLQFKFIENTDRSLSQVGADRLKGKLLPPKSVMVSCIGSAMGKVVMNRRPCVTNQQFNSIVVDQLHHSPDYIYYALKNNYRMLRNAATGSTALPLLNKTDFDRLKLRVHDDKDEQVRVATILSALDAKIELNNRINAELEGMAKLLYDYWFVQFDFPLTAAQANAMGNPKLQGQPYRASGGKMLYNETLKREIPEGWTDGNLLDVATFTNGIACQKYPADGGDTLRVIKIKDMRAGLTPDSDIVTANVPTKVKIRNGDILFSWSASLEVMIWAGGEGALNQHIFKVTSDTHPRSFCYFVLLDYLRHFRMMADLRKTTMGHITIDHLEQSQIAIPDDAVAKAFEVITKPIIDRMVKSHEENQELTQLRDWLLPMLMNGQVTVG